MTRNSSRDPRRDGGHGGGSLLIMGMPIGQFALRAGALGAVGLSCLQTFRGLQIFFGGAESITGWIAPAVAAAIVQGGLFAVSLWVAQRFLQSKVTARRGASDGIGSSITWLASLILAILFPLSLLFAYAGYHEGQTRSQEPEARILAAQSTAVSVANDVRSAADQHRRNITKRIVEVPGYATWQRGVDGLIELGAHQDTTAKVEEFIRANRVAIDNARIESERLERVNAARVGVIRRDIEELKKREESLQKEQDKCSRDDLQKLIDAEQGGTKLKLCDRETSGIKTCGPRCQQLTRELTGRQQRLRQIAEVEIPKIAKDIADKEKEIARITTPPSQAGSDPARQSLIGELAKDPRIVGSLTQRMKDERQSLAGIYERELFQKAVETCGRLQKMLALVYAEDPRATGAACEVADLGRDVNEINAFAEVQAKAQAVCATVPPEPVIDGLADDRRKGDSLKYLGDARTFANKCLGAAQLPQEDTTRIRRRVADLDATYGEKANYLTRVMQALVVDREQQAFQSFAVALAFDGLILVLAFLSELVGIKLNTTRIPPLNENEQTTLTRNITLLRNTDERDLEAQRLLVEHMSVGGSSDGAYELDLSKASEQDRQLAGTLVVPLLDKDVGLAWPYNRERTRFGVHPRGYYRMVKDAEETLRLRQAEAKAAEEEERRRLQLAQRGGPQAARPGAFDKYNIPATEPRTGDGRREGPRVVPDPPADLASRRSPPAGERDRRDTGDRAGDRRDWDDRRDGGDRDRRGAADRRDGAGSTGGGSAGRAPPASEAATERLSEQDLRDMRRFAGRAPDDKGRPRS